MQPMAALRKRFETEVWPRPFEPLPRIGSDGLMLGHGTVLARWARNQAGHAFAEADGERVVALLSAVHGRPVSPEVMKHVARAAMRWSAGEKALAHIELAFARLPRLDTSEDGYRLFLAGRLLDEGTTPRQLAEALGFDPDVLKYDPDQPRVPAGNGRESGRWGGGEAGLIEGRSSAGHTTGQTISKPRGQIDPSVLTFTALQVAANGPLEPDGTDIIPFPGVDPLDPHQLNMVPSRPEQQAIADTLNTIRAGKVDDIEQLNSHPYRNFPHKETGAVLPPAIGGYIAYDVFYLIGKDRGTSRLIIDQGTGAIYYTNTHYRSFYDVKLNQNHK